MHRRDAEGVRASLAPTFAGKANGRAIDLEAQVALASSFFEGFPDGAFKLEPTGGSGRHVIAWNFLGTHGGTYLGIPATGRLLRLDGYIIAVSDATGITSLEWKWDTKKFMAMALGPENLEGALPGKPGYREPKWARQGSGRPGGGGPGQGKKGKGGNRDRKPRGPRPNPPSGEATPAPASEPAAAEPAPAEAPAAPPTDVGESA